jgi:copper chaperone CopZ
MVETVYCVHCGAVAKHPVTQTIDGQALTFCCRGCLQVYELMRAEGLAASPADPAAALASQPASGSQSARLGGGSRPPQTLTLPIAGMSCGNCAVHVERGLRSVAGVISVSVRLAAEQATVEFDPDRATIADLKRAVEAAGYEVPDAAHT